MTDALWQPGETATRSRLHAFGQWVSDRHDVDASEYDALWRWSIEDIGRFWGSIWEFFQISPDVPDVVLDHDEMPGAEWFPGVSLNYAESVFRKSRRDETAVVGMCEGVGEAQEMTWGELERQVGALAETLRHAGVTPGDRVVAYLPNIPQAVVAFLATAAIGAVWAACGQDYAADAAASRFRQLEPTVLITADGYRYGGRVHDRRAEVEGLRGALPSLRLTICVDNVGSENGASSGIVPWESATAGELPVRFANVPFAHPLWVVFSSGTTGEPKGLVHSHGGVVLEHTKALGLHFDVGRDDRMFWFTSPSWMMWNFQTSALLLGASIVCFDGSPTHPATNRLWDLVARAEATVFGTSPGYLRSCEKAAVEPRDHDLSRLKSVGVTGSPLAATTSVWAATHLGPRIPVFSIAGGTDVVSAFVGGAPTVPVWPGRLSVAWLGVAIASFDDAGEPVLGDTGELVVTKPMPSMPIRFWNDENHDRYRSAYFGKYDGVWKHGDWLTIQPGEGVIVHGRSDSTLNRNGIRIGSADIYSIVEQLPEVAEALVLGVEEGDGGYWMPLFIVPASGYTFDDSVAERIRQKLRVHASARHVPDTIICAPGIPHTRTGKKIEVPLKRIFQGKPAHEVVAPQSLDRPELVKWYADLASTRSAISITRRGAFI